MALFEALWRSGITVVLVTHEPDIAAYASRVIVMKDGRVLSDRGRDLPAARVSSSPALATGEVTP
jgi:putative ABC transport system ATP-binding protein